MGAEYTRGAWDSFEDRPHVTPLDVTRLRVVRSCHNDAIFVTSTDGSSLFEYTFSGAGGRVKASDTERALAFRKVGGKWTLVY
jgi:hypothetical protein